MSNLVKENLYGSKNWTAPAGVTQLQVNIITAPFPNNDVESGGSGGSPFLDNYGTAYAWGNNSGGQLGVGDLVSRSSPVAVLGGFTFDYLASRGGFSFGLIAGKAYAWGGNNHGQLAVGDVVARSSPVAVVGGLFFSKIAQSGLSASALALSVTGTAYAWGRNENGQLGLGDVASRSSPVAVLGGLQFHSIELFNSSTASTVSAMGLTPSGQLYAWGANSRGELGVGDTTARSSPVAVVGGITFMKISTAINSLGASQPHVFGLATDGTLYAWGDNVNGQLGLGDVVGRSSPVAVLGGLKFVDVAASTSSVYAMTNDGKLYAWGKNDNGQLGVGDVIPRSSPVAVLGGLKFSRLLMRGGATNSSAYALTEDGILYAWGINSSGVLGVGDSTPRSSPVAVVGGIKFSEVYQFGLSNFGVDQSGKTYAWGTNGSQGALGVGDATNRSSPVAIAGITTISRTPVRYTHSFTVIPGQTYSILLGDLGCSFGGVSISNTPTKRATLVYMQ